MIVALFLDEDGCTSPTLASVTGEPVGRAPRDSISCLPHQPTAGSSSVLRQKLISSPARLIYGKFRSSAMAAPINPLDPNPAAEEFAVIMQRFSTVSPHFLNWNNNVSLELSIPLARFVRSLSIISNIDDEEIQDAAFCLGIRNRFFCALRNVSPRELYNFCEWLSTSRGNQEWTKLQHELKLRRRAEPGRAVEDSALISAFQQQTADQAIALKEVRLEADMEVAELRRRINEVIVRRDADVEKLRSTFFPACEYVPLAEDAFNDACWEMYQRDESERIGVQGQAKTEESLQKVRYVYGSRVSDAHLLEFVSDPVRRDELLRYIDEKITGFVMAHDLTQATRFRRLLATASAQEAAAVGVGRAEENVGVDAGAEGAEACDGDVILEAAGGEDAAATVTERGGSGHRGGGGGPQRARGGAQAVRPSARRGHPHRQV